VEGRREHGNLTQTKRFAPDIKRDCFLSKHIVEIAFFKAMVEIAFFKAMIEIAFFKAMIEIAFLKQWLRLFF